MTQNKKEFTRDLHRALRHLYEPMELRNSPLVSVFDLQQQEDIPNSIRKLLIDSIHSLKPDSRVPPESNSWRIYKILCFRFEEQFSQEEVASQIAVSPRHIRRLETYSVQALADFLIERHNLFRIPGTDPKAGIISLPDEKLLGEKSGELEWLKTTYQPETVEIKGLIDSVLSTGQSLLAANSGGVSVSMPDHLPLIYGQITTLRQVLLNLLVAATRTCPQSPILLKGRSHNGLLEIDIHSERLCDTVAHPETVTDLLKSAQNLVELSNGHMVTKSNPALSSDFSIQLVLQTTEKIPILFIDDNYDSLQLFERYLEGTRFQFHFSRNPHTALQTAVEIQARIIVLDVMLPDIDGWELLGRIRIHPVLESTPVVISTILPQEQLAYSLGASGFLNKPVLQEDLLSLLNRYL